MLRRDEKQSFPIARRVKPPGRRCRLSNRMVLAAYPVRLKPPCDEKTRLRVAYQSALDRHDRAVDETVRARGKVPKQEYERIRSLEIKRGRIGTPPGWRW